MQNGFWRSVHGECEGDILIIHTGYHHFGWDQPYADEIRYMVQHPGPDREFSVWAKDKKIKWIGVDCGSADHPMNTIIRDWMPRQAAEADKVFQQMYGATLADRFTPDKYQLMHIEMFPHHIIHAECVGGDIDLLVNRRATVGLFPWRFVDGESSIGRCVALVDDDKYEALMVEKAVLPKFGEAYNPEHVESIQRLTKRFWSPTKDTCLDNLRQVSLLRVQMSRVTTPSGPTSRCT